MGNVAIMFDNYCLVVPYNLQKVHKIFSYDQSFIDSVSPTNITLMIWSEKLPSVSIRKFLQNLFHLVIAWFILRFVSFSLCYFFLFRIFLFCLFIYLFAIVYDVSLHSGFIPLSCAFIIFMFFYRFVARFWVVLVFSINLTCLSFLCVNTLAGWSIDCSLNSESVSGYSKVHDGDRPYWLADSVSETPKSFYS